MYNDAITKALEADQFEYAKEFVKKVEDTA